MTGPGRGGSIRRRLVLWLMAATLGIGAAGLVDTRAEALRTAQGVSDRILAGAALAIAERVTVSADGGFDVDIPFSALAMLSSAAQDQVFYRVDGPVGPITGYADLSPVTVPRTETAAFADQVTRGVPVRAATLARDISTGQGPVRISVTVAESTRAREALARSILWRSAARFAGLIAAAIAAVWIATRVALRPLDRLGAAIALRPPHDLRPVEAAVPQEVGGLVAAIDGFMARLASAIAALRTFTGNANHQIRTPLATARTQIALAARAPGAGAAAEALGKADAALVQAERVLAQLLLLAQVEAAGARPALQPVDVAALARDLARETVPAAAAQASDLGYDGEAALTVAAEPVLLAELVRNLLDNALRHAGPGAEVTLRTGAAPAPWLSVEDTGPPLPQDRLAALARALAPPDGLDIPRPSADGHGLGLVIVRDIARAQGAVAEATAGPGGRGLKVTLRFPA